MASKIAVVSNRGLSDASLFLECRDLHIPDDEAACLDDLKIQRTRNICGIELIGGAFGIRTNIRSPIGNGLDIGIGQPGSGVSGRHQDTGNGWPRDVIVVASGHAELVQ